MKGRQFFVQINGNRVCLSFDASDEGHTFWMSLEEFDLLVAACKLALHKKEVTSE